VTVSGGVLGGTGTINGPVTIQPGGTLSPGTNVPGAASIATLSIANTLSLGGTNYMELNKTAATCDLIQGLTSVTYGGVLVISNISGTLAAGDSFKLYDASSYSGSFLIINPATPGAGLSWDTSSLTVDGTLKVASAAPASSPRISSVAVSGATVSLSGTNGTPNHVYHLLTSTNITLPTTSWTSVATNQFDGSGNFNVTQPYTPASAQVFYLLRVPLP
jgi:hypothetical protein